jgi:hypothetical protein
MAYEFKAFTRAWKIKTPQQLLRAVLLYCGLDQTLWEVDSTMTLLGQRPPIQRSPSVWRPVAPG